MGKDKRNRLAISGSLAGRISYSRCYEEEGIIRSPDGRYTRMYRVHSIDGENAAEYDAETAKRRMAEILNALPQDVRFQFVIHNRFVDADESRMGFLIDPKTKEEALRTYVEAYDRVVLDNAEIGHNNTKKSVYYILSVEAETVDDAVRRFKSLEPELAGRFAGLYGIRIEGMGLLERLEILYAMFNPYGADFGKKIDLNGSGRLDLGNLRYMHLTTKDLVAPSDWNTARRLIDHSILDEKSGHPVFVRAFYVESVPKQVSASFVGDMTSVSSQMVFSMIYEPVDTGLGFREASEAVAANTSVRTKTKRDTIADRRGRTETEEHLEKELGESGYFHKAALKTFRDAKAGENRTFFCTFTVLLYGESLEALDRDTELLHLSAAKFSASVNALDLEQCRGFQTSLPLCQSHISCGRVFDSGRLSVMSPVGIQDAIRRGGLYLGINAVNDNLILLNRKNNTNLSGLIAGTDHPGCTYQMKREAFNALIGTEDVVHIITASGEYDEFAERAGGVMEDFMLPDLFDTEEGYGLLEDDHGFKSYFLEALFTCRLSTRSGLQEDTEKRTKAEAECSRLAQRFKEQGIREGAAAVRLLEREQEQYPLIAAELIDLFSEYGEMRHTERSGERLVIHRAADIRELLILMDMLWNRVLRDKHDGISDWIFIDPADALLLNPSAADYLVKYMQNASLFQTVMTVTLGSVVRILGEPSAAAAFEGLVQGMGYVKLLNQGPVERKRFAELLSIPNALLPYVSNVEPGKGIIITPSGNAAFNDNYTELYPEGIFKDLFARKVEQIRFDQRGSA